MQTILRLPRIPVLLAFARDYALCCAVALAAAGAWIALDLLLGWLR
jgi:hypothetical protein